MHKNILILLVAFCCSFQGAFADIITSEDDGWSYVFHFEYANNTLAPDSHTTGGLYDKRADELYTPIFKTYVEKTDPASTDYYGVIVSILGKEEWRFGFNRPETTVSVLGKSIYDVNAPFFADADHVDVFTQNGKKLFSISLKGSSFCNDDKKCNADVGEDYKNCPHDCPPPPPVTTTPVATTTPTTPTVQPTTETPEVPVVVSNSTGTTPTAGGLSSKTTITLGVLGIVFLVLIFILWKLRGFRDE